MIETYMKVLQETQSLEKSQLNGQLLGPKPRIKDDQQLTVNKDDQNKDYKY